MIKKYYLFILFSSLNIIYAQDAVLTRSGREIKVNADATNSTKGGIKLTGDLGGTADSPTVPALTNKLEGTGTLNYVPKFSAAKTLTDSQIFDDGTHVGIGTNVPTTQLHVKGDFGGILLERTAGVDPYDQAFVKLMNKDGGSFQLRSSSGVADGFHFTNSNATTIYMTGLSSGNIGIGTTTPANKLEITQGTSGNSGLRFTNLNSSSTASTSLSKVLAVNSTGDVILTNVPGTQNIIAFSTTTPTTSGVVFTPNTPADQSVVYQSSVDNSMWTYNGSTYVTYTAPASTAWFTSGTTNDAGNSKTSNIYRTGRVGIGASSPSSPLVVQGVTGNGVLKLIAPSVASGDNWWMGFGHGTTSTDANDRARIGVNIVAGGSGRLFFATGASGSQNTAMFIDESQRVGIGTTTPESRLHVRFDSGGLSPTFERISTGSVASTSLKFLLNSSSTTIATQTSGFFGQGLHFAYKSDTETEKSVGAITSKITDYANNKGELSFIVNGNTTAVPSMIIKDSGNVGIGTLSPVSKLEVNGTVGALVRTSAVSTTTSNDFTLLMSTAGTVVTLEAPTAVTRRIMAIKNTSSGTVSVTGHIDGTASTTFVLLSKESIEIQSDGTTWQIIAKYNSAAPLAVSAQLNPVSIPNNTNTSLTSYTNVTDTSSGAWNPTTGVYTCNKAGLYRFEFRALFARAAWTQGNEINAMLFRNDVNVNAASWFAASSYNQWASTGHNFASLNLVVGDRIRVVIWQNSGSTRTTHAREYTNFSIYEIR
jgi:hypothetical protein